jgi:hypothetical protein
VPSVEHQWLLLWAIRKMAQDGFVPAACDGPMPQGGVWNELCPSWKLGAFRPDAWGTSVDGRRVAICEAKSSDDILNPHSRSQLAVFGSFVRRRGRLYLAVPRSDAWRLDKILASLGLAGAPFVVRIHVPDCFLSEARL